MNVYWSQPQFLWLIAPAVLIAVLMSLLGRRRMSPAGRWIIPAVRGVWAAACVAALCGPGYQRVETLTQQRDIILLRDVSRSIGDDGLRAQQWAADFRQKLPPTRLRGDYTFAAVPTDKSNPDATATDIAAAIDTATGTRAGDTPTDVVLLTDGRQTNGDAIAAARRFAARGASRVHVIPIGTGRTAPPSIVGAVPAGQAKLNASTPVRLTVESMTNDPYDVTIADPSGKVIETRRLQGTGRKTTIFRVAPKEAGLLNYVVTSKSNLGNDHRQLPIHVEGPDRILVCDPFQSETKSLVRALSQLGYPIDVITPDQWPADLSKYAAVVISDWSGRELNADQRAQLQRAVERDGMGLLCIAGENFLPVEWKQGPLAEMLPVTFQEPPKDKPDKPKDVAVVYVLDRSGSMNQTLPGGGNVNKLEMVKAAIQASLQTLDEHGEVAVVSFDTRVDVVVPPTPLSKKAEVAKLLDQLGPGGGTNMGPGVEKGMELLATMKGAKYLVVLSDGVTQPPPGGDAFWRDMTDQATRENISWTSIAVGADAHAKLLEDLAQRAAGRFFQCLRSDQIPQVFVAQAKAMSNDKKPVNKPFKPQPGPDFALLKKLPLPDTFPDLGGRVRAVAKPRVQTIQLAPEDQPLLATWQYGLGRVTVFASDAKPRWAKTWVEWSDYATYWCEVVQQLARRKEQIDVDVRTFRVSGHEIFRCRAVDEQGRPVIGLKPAATRPATTQPGGEASAVTWRTSEPGVYEAKVPRATPRDTGLVTLTLQSPDVQFRYSAFVGGSQSEEERFTGPDHPMLQKIAEAGGGTVSDDVQQVATRCLESITQVHTKDVLLWRYLIMAALLYWPLDVLLRRLLSE